MSKLIKIIRGVYGYKNGIMILPKTSKDKPFEVDDEIASKLIAKGVAEIATPEAVEAEPVVKYIVNLAKAETKVVNKKEAEPVVQEEVQDVVEADEEYSENNTKKELLEILAERGYEITPKTEKLTKAEIIALLDEQNEAGEEYQPSFEDDGVVE